MLFRKGKIWKTVMLLAFPLLMNAQDDLLSEIDTTATDVTVESAFKSLKIVNLESTKLAAKGDFYFIVAHRFGFIDKGFDDFFGLDNANTQLKFLYGVKSFKRSSSFINFAIVSFSLASTNISSATSLHIIWNGNYWQTGK